MENTGFIEGQSPVKNNEYFNRLETDGEDGTEFIDHWDTGELLFLSSSVLRSDRNWASVARSIKPYGEITRPSDWYTPKNCALQYNKLLNEIDEEAKKKTVPRTEREISEVMLVKQLTEKRLKDLEYLNQQTKNAASALKVYLEMVDNGDFDENLDELCEMIDAEERGQEVNFEEYIRKRENLNVSKKLNKSRITKNKTKVKAADTRKKIPTPIPDSTGEPLHIKEEITIKKEIDTDDDTSASSTPVTTKSEMEAPLTLNALLDSKSSIPSSAAPFLTSLLRNTASSTPGSHTFSFVNSLKEEPMDTSEMPKTDTEAGARSKEASPRSSVPQSPYPTPASSPLLNSLLKNSPSSSTTPFQLSTGKEISSKEVSSPQPFFNPTSALATAAAQQLAVATSTLPQFFQTHELSEGCKSSVQSSPVTSACLSAPTLSKLLEMPPSTPGRLPPLPIPDPPAVTTLVSSPVVTPESVPKSSNTQEESSNITDILKSPVSFSKKMAYKVATDSFSTDTSVLQKSLTSYSLADKKSLALTSKEESKISIPEKVLDIEITPEENIDLIESVCESINQTIDDSTLEKVFEEEQKQIVENPESETAELSSPLKQITPMELDPPAEKDIPDSDVKNEHSVLQEELIQTATADSSLDQELISSNQSAELDTTSTKTDAASEEASGKKFYKSRTKKEDVIEKRSESPNVSQSSKKSTPLKVEPETQVALGVGDKVSITREASPEPVAEKQLDTKSSKVIDTKSPVSKKPRFFEKGSAEKKEFSAHETPTTVRRSGRRGKKGSDKSNKNAPSKLVEPSDQYEFTESTEENSIGYQASNTLCYMPRVKEDSRSEDSKKKPSSVQESKDSSTVSSPASDKKASISYSKQDVSSARKALFMSDDEKVSDSFTSDETSNQSLNKEKLKPEETTEKKDSTSKPSAESSKHTSKAPEPTKKKSKKRAADSKSNPKDKERKISSSVVEELSTGSGDSEEIPIPEKEVFDSKTDVPIASIDMEVETSDSHPSSIAAEFDKQLDDVEGSESLQDSITSPPPSNESKDVKDTSQFGKQDWFHIVSPKSSEAVSQSSEESEEYESDNWDNQSVSTNKSASHSAGVASKVKRKERETPQHKAWKRAISIVLREISCHKYASVFLQKVTNDVAPGYLNIVYRPIDLSLIKRNIDNGVITTTDEFHRDILLMFQNAIMYNSSDHDVHQMAVEMRKDVIQLIMTFLTTQSDKSDTSEPVSSLRGARKSQKGLGKQAATG
ncbi:bromodomain-containing protein 8 [Trichonephila inaurata madagascariensis]|uniref:Bromodomain-containing protein 8 n=1 Tax=Trichonephila inaurata madagascariensis TaxID=2747483 RepID=A0A8X6XZP1_9ARAC|nr:bromodomain-containing protein 8 [Trichonephila inaurata madagascariensis]